MTLEELEQRAQISAEMLSAYERGQYQPSLDKLLSLQHALRLSSIENLFGDVDSPFMPSARLWSAASQTTEGAGVTENTTS
jgi:transcriptional regulator with XRE-family HTH domain